ncbi:hypothetical protein ACF0H5_003355 [Mactra antiquata]
MISKVGIFTKCGEVIVEKDFRNDVPFDCFMKFGDKIKSLKGSTIPPHYVDSGVRYFNIQRNDIYIVACSMEDILPVMVIELLTRLYHICKDFCGIVTELSIKENILLIYELLDEFMNEGYVQLANTEKICPYILSTPVVVQKERSPATEMSSRVFGIETKLISSTASDKPVIQSATDSNKNELYVDVIERMSAVISANGTVSRIDVIGSVNVKNFLSGSPQISIILNEDLVVSDGKLKGYGNSVQLDRCTFHTCVKQEDFNTARKLTLAPPVGEISALTYNVNGEISLNQPFTLNSFVGDADGSRDLRVTLRLNANFSSNKRAVKMKVKFSVPKSISSVSTKLMSDEHSSTFDKEKHYVIWFIKQIPGKTESMAEFRLNNQGNNGLTRQDIDPISIDFEISGYTSSNIQVKGVKVQSGDKKNIKQKTFVRLITVSDSYVFRTF